jgi:hypothetical protein
MKKISLSLLLAVVALFSGINNAKAQNETGQVSVSAGVGFSVLFGVINIAENQATDEGITHSTLPALNMNIDYGISPKFSLGLGVGYQSTTINYTNYEATTSSGYDSLYNFGVTISRLNIGLRPIYHFGKNDKLDIYTGGRIGLSIWSISTTASVPGYSGPFQYSGVLPSFQYLFGMKAYFTPSFGAHFEVAIGTPYLIEAGLNYRFGGIPASVPSR